jgi:hypothetical protein
MDHLENIYKKLQSKIEVLKYMFLIFMFVITVIAVVTLYTLKIDMKGSIDRLREEIRGTMYPDHCDMSRGI